MYTDTLQHKTAFLYFVERHLCFTALNEIVTVFSVVNGTMSAMSPVPHRKSTKTLVNLTGWDHIVIEQLVSLPRVGGDTFSSTYQCCRG